MKRRSWILPVCGISLILLTACGGASSGQTAAAETTTAAESTTAAETMTAAETTTAEETTAAGTTEETESTAETEEETAMESSAGTWVCSECSAENQETERFCRTCGAPREAKTGMFMKREEWPEDGHYPTLKEVREKKEDHGPLISVTMSSSSSGMMMGSYAKSSLELSRADGEGRLVHMDMRVYEPIITSIYSAEDEVFEKMQALADRENLAAWSFLREDPEKKMVVYDYSSSAGITLVFDDTSVGGSPRETRSIDYEAVSQQGGTEVWKEISDLLYGCIDPEKLLKTKQEPNPYRNPFTSSGPAVPPVSSDAGTSSFAYTVREDGTWTCPACGYSENEGRFCAECGSTRPK